MKTTVMSQKAMSPHRASGVAAAVVPRVCARNPKPAVGKVAAPEIVVVALGSNLGDAREHLAFAVDGLGGLEHTLGLRLRVVSPLYRTAPWQTDGPDFLNAVAVLEGVGSDADDEAPQRLLQALLDLEADRGRQRPYRYAPRTLDLDLILYGQRVINTERLTVPHPRALERAFVLQPLLDVCPDLSWPGVGRGWSVRMQQLPDPPPQRQPEPWWPPAP
jgi:2-amino-4-hydroxy-6-hydroxymethyldihydropteridine diphosphokinase